jgi:hypothetical protein
MLPAMIVPCPDAPSARWQCSQATKSPWPAQIAAEGSFVFSLHTSIGVDFTPATDRPAISLLAKNAPYGGDMVRLPPSANGSLRSLPLAGTRTLFRFVTTWIAACMDASIAMDKIRGTGWTARKTPAKERVFSPGSFCEANRDLRPFRPVW